METEVLKQRFSRRLIRSGILLFLLGLVTGLFVQMLANPRMALSSHLEGVMSGMFLIILGLVWPRLRLSHAVLTAAYWLAIYGAFVNWATTLIAAAWAAGGSMMPMASLGHKGTPVQELIIAFGAVSLALAFLATCFLVLWGIRGRDEGATSQGPSSTQGI
jgi:hydroxylaminobenzene mutase